MRKVLPLLFGLLAFAQAQQEIAIGAIYPLTGPLASTGLELKQAVELGVDLVNNPFPQFRNIPLAAGAGLPRLAGARIRVIFADSQGKPEVGQAEAERLITQGKVVALIGAYQSAVTRTASRVAEQYGIPFLNPESSSPDLTERGYRWFFRTTPNDETFIEGMMRFLDTLKGLPTKRVGVVYENTDFGVNTAKAVEKYAALSGRQVVVKIAYPAATTSVISEVQRLEAAKPDVAIFASYTSDAILFVRTMRQVGYAPPILLANDAGFIDSQFLKEVGPQVEGVLTRDVWANDLALAKPIIGQINKLYRDRYGRDLNGNSARSLQGLLVLAEAINRAGSTQPAAIQKALRETNLLSSQIFMPWGGVRFDEKGQNVLGQGLILQLVKGEYRTVWPDRLATVKPQLPFGWK